MMTSSTLALAHLLAPLALLVACGEAASPPLKIELRALWISGADGDRTDMDRYFECLLHQSDLDDYWRGEATARYAGSFVVPPPATRVDYTTVTEYVGAQRASGVLPAPSDPSVTPVDVVFGDRNDLDLPGCAALIATNVEGRPAGAIMVGLAPPCWPGTTGLRNATQLVLQELVEVVDLLLGYAPYAGDGACQADGACDLGCDAFVGLTCEGAPTGTYTGCGGQVLDGWVVQRLSHEGRLEKNAKRCNTCDFVPRAVSAGSP